MLCGGSIGKFSKLALIPGFLVALCCSAESAAAGDELLEMSISELLRVEVTSVSKKSEELFRAAAAVHVITAEDIRRSGVASIPEALRMAPGVNVSRIDGNKWAISARGFSDRFANKLLVLIDGRSVYTPLFAGVYWDVQDVLLEDVARIEVIRGPGATLWGANAVNGVIDIITKHSRDTAGSLVSGRAGFEETAAVAARHGGSFGENASYRVYIKHQERDGGVGLASGEDTADEFEFQQAGFRLDWERGRDAVTAHGGVYTGESGASVRLFSLTPPHRPAFDAEEDVKGGNFLLRWERDMPGGSELSAQAYYDHTRRNGPLFREDRNTVDLEVQHRFKFGGRQDIVWGLGYRYAGDDIRGSETIVLMDSARNDQLFSGFVQDEITLVPATLRFTVGTKLEHNDYSGFEIQPGARLLWTPSEQHTLWGSVARAVRTPSRADHDIRVNGLFGVDASGAVPRVTAVVPNDGVEAEELLAYELGYRIRPSERLWLDAAVFYNDYDNLRSASTGTTVCEPSGLDVAANPLCALAATNLLTPLVLANDVSGETYGLELSADWHPAQRWHLQAYYAFLEMHLHSKTGFATDESAEQKDPHHQFSLRAGHQPRHDLDADLWLRFKDNIPAVGTGSRFSLDARLAWRPQPDLELALVGRNLLDDREKESLSELGDIPQVELERSAYVQMRWSF